MPRLSVIALAFGAFTLVASVVGIARHLPYQFGGTGDPDSVAADAFLHGTGISAPLVFVAVIIVLAWVAGRRGWIGIAAAAVVALLGTVGILAGFMEPALRTLDPLVTPIAVLGIGLAALLVVSAVRVVLTATGNRRSTV
ncbi:MAG: hypothetical protein DLM71_02410 [Chloroflexi bacterium]|nr:MAG: hypothetical protein DLM71_02410 [Chloroflexota bacterium]